MTRCLTSASAFALILSCGLLLGGCSSNPEAPDTPDATVADDAAATHVPGPCDVVDAGDEAWVKQALFAVVGRRAFGMREVDVLVAAVERSGRAAVVESMMSRPEFLRRWSDWLLDYLRVNRIEDKSHDACFGAPLLADDTGDLARFLVTAAADEQAWGEAFNMADVLRSSLVADDLSPLFRAHLFAMMAKPSIFCANTPEEAMEASRREEFGDRFFSVYTHRTMSCLQCHNSDWAVNDSADAAADKHWPLPGSMEAALWGESTGTSTVAAYAPFRFRGVVSAGVLVDAEEMDLWPEDAHSVIEPWGMDPSCGQFAPRAEITSDPLGSDAFMGEPLGGHSSVWDVEAILREGLAAATLATPTDPLAGAEALARLLAAALAEGVWTAVHGSALTLGHGFPRNEAQHERLRALTDTVLLESWSLRAVIAELVLDDAFNHSPPEEACTAGDDPYQLPPVHQPFSVEESIQARQGNSVGDMVHRPNGRLLLTALSYALERPLPAAFPIGDEHRDDATALELAGAFLTDFKAGTEGIDFQSAVEWELTTGSCGQSYYAGEDFITAVVAAVQTSDVLVSGRDVAVALKDRLINEPDLDDEEADHLRRFFKLADLDADLRERENLEELVRHLCGVLTLSPQFGLVGMAPADQTTRPEFLVGDVAEADYAWDWEQAFTAAGIDSSAPR